jgi:hypothetical protein
MDHAEINILRKFKFILDRKTLETIYTTFIRPILEYADVVWDTKTQILINKLENVQVEATRNHVNMFIPITIVRKLKSKVFMFSNRTNDSIIHNKVRLMGFI